MSTIEQTNAHGLGCPSSGEGHTRSSSQQPPPSACREEITCSAEEIGRKPQGPDAANASGLAAALLDWLTVTDATIAAMAQGCEALLDPVGSMGPHTDRTGCRRMRIPLG
jgi:gamma-glutamyl phosphate reductase